MRGRAAVANISFELSLEAHLAQREPVTVHGTRARRKFVEKQESRESRFLGEPNHPVTERVGFVSQRLQVSFQLRNSAMCPSHFVTAPNGRPFKVIKELPRPSGDAHQPFSPAKLTYLT